MVCCGTIGSVLDEPGRRSASSGSSKGVRAQQMQGSSRTASATLDDFSAASRGSSSSISRPSHRDDGSVLVIGAGIVGASIAYHLARAGCRVKVLERDFAARGVTGSSFASVGLEKSAAHTYSDPFRRSAAEEFDRLVGSLRFALISDGLSINREVPRLACVCAMTDCRYAAVRQCAQSLGLSTLRTQFERGRSTARKPLRFGAARSTDR